MQEIAITLIQNDPLLIASMAASLVGLFLWYLYRGFIHNNYRRIQWFRRFFLPHVTLLLREISKRREDIDLNDVYVESKAYPGEQVFDLRLAGEESWEKKVEEIGDYLIKDEHFRPEVILTSLAKHPEGYPEVGNFVLTAPNKNRSSFGRYGVFKEIMIMFTSKYQLHLRLYYDENKHRILFHTHHEMNPYNPLYAKKHLKGKELNYGRGKMLFRKYKDNIRKFGVELIE